MSDIIHFVDKSAAPSLLPIFRSQQQAEILLLVLGDPDRELGVTEISERTGVPYPSTHREIERAERAGLITSRRVGRTRVVQANVDSPYFSSLADLLVKAFGPPRVLADALGGVSGIDRALLFGSWAASHHGEELTRPVADIDLLVLGEPDRDAIYAALSEAERRLGREVQVTIRPAGWLEEGSGSFHTNVVERPMVELGLTAGDTDRVSNR